MAIGNTNLVFNTGDWAWLRFLESGTISPADTAIEANTVSELFITDVWWSSGDAIDVSRGSTHVLSLHGGGRLPPGFGIADEPTANVHVTFSGDGTLLVKVFKKH